MKGLLTEIGIALEQGNLQKVLELVRSLKNRIDELSIVELKEAERAIRFYAQKVREIRNKLEKEIAVKEKVKKAYFSGGGVGKSL